MKIIIMAVLILSVSSAGACFAQTIPNSSMGSDQDNGTTSMGGDSTTVGDNMNENNNENNDENNTEYNTDNSDASSGMNNADNSAT